MAKDDAEDRVISLKEKARLQRRAAYQAAKERWKNDPRRLALKEAAKVKRRAASEQAKAKRKAAAELAKAKRKEEHAAKVEERRAETAKELWELVTWVSKGSNAKN